jgi:hypothetical protein
MIGDNWECVRTETWKVGAAIGLVQGKVAVPSARY